MMPFSYSFLKTKRASAFAKTGSGRVDAIGKVPGIKRMRFGFVSPVRQNLRRDRQLPAAGIKRHSLFSIAFELAENDRFAKTGSGQTWCRRSSQRPFKTFSQKQLITSKRRTMLFIYAGAASADLRQARWDRAQGIQKTQPCFASFDILKTDHHFTKTGSGQNISRERALKREICETRARLTRRCRA